MMGDDNAIGVQSNGSYEDMIKIIKDNGFSYEAKEMEFYLAPLKW
jgi:hypothetical protein